MFLFLCSYKPLGYHKIGKTGDRVELYGISRDDILGASDPLPNPDCIERSRPQLKTYIETANQVVDVVLGHLERHLKLPRGTFAKLQPMTEPSGSVLRMLRYEPQVSKELFFPFRLRSSGSSPEHSYLLTGAIEHKRRQHGTLVDALLTL